LHLILCDRADGREGISALVASDVGAVRMSAAAWCCRGTKGCHRLWAGGSLSVNRPIVGCGVRS